MVTSHVYHTVFIYNKYVRRCVVRKRQLRLVKITQQLAKLRPTVQWPLF